MINEIKKFLTYGIGGFLAFLLTFTSTYYFTEHLNLYYFLSAILGYLLGFFVNFTFQAFITFHTKTDLYFYRFLKFVAFQLIGLIFYSSLLAIFTEIFHFYYLYSLILSAVLTYILNFFLIKFFVFKKLS